MPGEVALIDEIGEGCLGEACRYLRERRCFLHQARLSAEAAHVLVVNHALFFSDLALRRAGASILPDYDVAMDLPGYREMEGVAEAGGTPLEFPSIAICDGLAPGHQGMRMPMISRELIADSIELMITSAASVQPMWRNIISADRISEPGFT